MSASRATSSSVATAMESLISGGNPHPSIDAVRELTGGSKTTVARLVKEYRAALDATAKTALPEKLEALHAEFLQRACAEATALASKSLVNEHRRLDILADALDAQMRSLKVERDQALERARDAEFQKTVLSQKLASAADRMAVDGSLIDILREQSRILRNRLDEGSVAAAGGSRGPTRGRSKRGPGMVDQDRAAPEQGEQLDLLTFLAEADQVHNLGGNHVS